MFVGQEIDRSGGLPCSQGAAARLAWQAQTNTNVNSFSVMSIFGVQDQVFNHFGDTLSFLGECECQLLSTAQHNGTSTRRRQP